MNVRPMSITRIDVIGVTLNGLQYITYYVTTHKAVYEWTRMTS